MFKPANCSLVVTFENGSVFAFDDHELFRSEMTAEDVVKWSEDPADVARVLVIDPSKVGRDRVGAVIDKTEEFLDAWLADLDILAHDESFGCPHAVTGRDWAALIREAKEAEADHRAMMRNPMSYHFGPNWAGIKGYR